MSNKNVLKTAAGTTNYVNWIQIAAALTGLVDIWQSFLPEGWGAILLLAAASITFLVNTFKGDTQGF